MVVVSSFQKQQVLVPKSNQAVPLQQKTLLLPMSGNLVTMNQVGVNSQHLNRQHQQVRCFSNDSSSMNHTAVHFMEPAYTFLLVLFRHLVIFDKKWSAQVGKCFQYKWLGISNSRWVVFKLEEGVQTYIFYSHFINVLVLNYYHFFALCPSLIFLIFFI